MNNFVNIPDEIILHVLLYCDRVCLFRFLFASKRFYEILIEMKDHNETTDFITRNFWRTRIELDIGLSSSFSLHPEYKEKIKDFNDNPFLLYKGFMSNFTYREEMIQKPKSYFKSFALSFFLKNCRSFGNIDVICEHESFFFYHQDDSYENATNMKARSTSNFEIIGKDMTSLSPIVTKNTRRIVHQFLVFRTELSKESNSLICVALHYSFKQPKKCFEISYSQKLSNEEVYGLFKTFLNDDGSEIVSHLEKVDTFAVAYLALPNEESTLNRFPRNDEYPYTSTYNYELHILRLGNINNEEEDKRIKKIKISEEVSISAKEWDGLISKISRVNDHLLCVQLTLRSVLIVNIKSEGKESIVRRIANNNNKLILKLSSVLSSSSLLFEVCDHRDKFPEFSVYHYDLNILFSKNKNEGTSRSSDKLFEAKKLPNDKLVVFRCRWRMLDMSGMSCSFERRLYLIPVNHAKKTGCVDVFNRDSNCDHNSWKGMVDYEFKGNFEWILLPDGRIYVYRDDEHAKKVPYVIDWSLKKQ